MVPQHHEYDDDDHGDQHQDERILDHPLSSRATPEAPRQHRSRWGESQEPRRLGTAPSGLLHQARLVPHSPGSARYLRLLPLRLPSGPLPPGPTPLKSKLRGGSAVPRGPSGRGSTLTYISSPGRPWALPVWPRFAAAALDFLVLLVPEAIAYQLIAGPTLSQALHYYNSHQKLGLANAVAHTPNYQPAVYHFYIAMEAITAAYLIASYLGFSATVGKLALRLRITRVDGSPLRVRDAVLRSLPFWVPLLLPSPVGVYVFFFQFLGGSILIIFRPDHRGPEDLLGNSMVVARQAQGKSLADAIGLARTPTQPRLPTLTPPSPTVARGGHLPGWEPVQSPPPSTNDGADEPGSEPKQEEKP